jgi:hypothetical protein
MAGRLSALRAQVDPILTTFAAGYNPPANLIARRVAPVVPTMVEAGTFYKFGKEGFKIYNSERALRANPARIDWTPSKDTFLCVEHALETQYDHQELEQAAAIGAERVLMMEQRAVQLVQNALENEFEKAVADTLFAAANYAAGNKTTLSGTSQWLTASGEGSASDPVKDIRDAIDAARDTMGRRPNTLVLGYDAWRALRDHSKMIERIKYSERAVLTPEIVAQVFDLQNVIVGEANYVNDSGSFVDLWGDNAALIYLPAPGELVEGTTPHTVTFELEGFPRVLTYDDAYRRTYGVQRKYDVKLIDNTYGFLIADVKA